MRIDWLFVAFIGLFYFGFTDNSRGPVYPHALNDLNISSALGSWLFALSSAAGLAVTLVSTFWLKKFSTITWMKISWPILALGFWFMGESFDQKSIIPLYIGSFFQGIGAGISTITMNLIVTQACDVLKRRRIFGALHGTYGIASLVAPVVYSTLYEKQIHWSQFFKYMAIVPFILLLVTWNIKGEKQVELPNTKLNTSRFLQILFGATLGLYVASEIVVSSRLVYFLTEGHGLAHKEASQYLSLFFLCLMGGRLSLAFFNISLKGESLLRASLLSTLLLLVLGMNGFYLAFSLSGFTMAVFFPCAMDCLSGWFPDSLDAMMAGAMSGIGVGLVFMHISFGQFADLYGIKFAMGSALFFCSLSYLCLETFLHKTKSIRIRL